MVITYFDLVVVVLCCSYVCLCNLLAGLDWIDLWFGWVGCIVMLFNWCLVAVFCLGCGFGGC